MARRFGRAYWVRLLKRHGEEFSSTYRRVVGVLPHPSESGFSDVIEEGDE